MVEARRLRRACLLVVALLMVVALWNPVATTVGWGPEPTPALSGRTFVEEALEASDARPFDGLSAASGVSRCDREEAPEWFAQEVLSLEGAYDVMAEDAWSIVGFSQSGLVSDVEACLRGELEQRGWVLMESGAEGLVTGIKEGGCCQWLWMSTTEVGEEVGVVVQVSGT